MARKYSARAFAEKLNYYSAFWFWITIAGVFYVGFIYILPVVYKDSSPTVIWMHEYLCYFMLAEMVMNWVCVKWVRSPFQPGDYKPEYGTDDDQLLATGFEINLNNLKRTGNENMDTAGHIHPSQVYNAGSNGTTVANINRNPGTMYLVAVPQPEQTDPVKKENNGIANGTSNSGSQDDRRLVYPYWSWKPCLICQVQRPPRVHHCPLCNMCILKRDHHCFFTGSCVGLRNQRYFIVFTFWASLATLYCFVHSLIYIWVEVFLTNNIFDLFLPITIVRWLLGHVKNIYLVMCVLLYSLTWFTGTAVGFLIEQIQITRKGVTSFEEDNNIKITNTRTPIENIKGVMGEKWWMNFIFPMHFFYPPLDDGIRWKNIKL